MMAAKQTKIFIRPALYNIQEVLKTMPEGGDKEKLKKTAELLQSALD